MTNYNWTVARLYDDIWAQGRVSLSGITHVRTRVELDNHLRRCDSDVSNRTYYLWLERIHEESL